MANEMRDRLVELMVEADAYDGYECKLCTDDHSCFRCYFTKLADHLIENGVIVPPCKVGDYVYDISEFFDGTNCPEIYEYRVDRIEITEEKGQQVLYIADLKYPSDEWGKSLHFSREDAEKALRKEGVVKYLPTYHGAPCGSGTK